MDYNEEEKEAVFTLLGRIFNSVNSFHRKSNVFYGSDHASRYRDLKSAAHPDYFHRYFYLNVQRGVFPDAVWDDFLMKINTMIGGDLERLIDTTIDEVIDSGMSQHWLNRMNLSLSKYDKRQIPNLIFAIANNVEKFSKETSNFFGLSEYEQIKYLIFHLLEQIDIEQASEIISRLVGTCSDFGFLHSILHLLETTPEDDSVKIKFAQLDFVSLKARVGNRLKEIYIENDQNILEMGVDRTLYALKEFVEPDIYKTYIRNLLNDDKHNALRLLTILISRGQWFSGETASTFRILDYRSLKSFIDPSDLKLIIENSFSTISLSDDESWALNALREGIEKEAKGDKVERIRELDQHRNIAN